MAPRLYVMRIMGILMLIAIFSIFPVASAVSRTAAIANVSIKDFSFNPTIITVNPGDTVIWTNNGSFTHTVTTDDGTSDTTLAPGATTQLTFSTAGTFAYYCKFHGGPGGVNMAGSVAVASHFVWLPVVIKSQ